MNELPNPKLLQLIVSLSNLTEKEIKITATYMNESMSGQRGKLANRIASRAFNNVVNLSTE